ncbi:hypothetical protein FOZ74_01375 [Comamonas flocculans]|uniref:Uncharacterized protein n=1 Tax=Comamonas flocculans TaxID=2597701 RepID=A0A5B8RRW6_9BURK|nr:hypothetical protein FOZ74_01375 [Comamonas flocculans]
MKPAPRQQEMPRAGQAITCLFWEIDHEIFRRIGFARGCWRAGRLWGQTGTRPRTGSGCARRGTGPVQLRRRGGCGQGRGQGRGGCGCPGRFGGR